MPAQKIKTKTRADGPKQELEINCAFDEIVGVEIPVPNPQNPNQHSDSQIEILAKIIKHQGWRAPIVVSRRSGFIVAGHARYEAAKCLGLDSVPVDYQDFKTEADEWAHLIADNRIAELSEENTEGIRDLLEELKGVDFDLGLTGFDRVAVQDLFADKQEDVPPEDFTPVDENIPTEYECPKCQYRWSGKSA